MQPEEKVHPVPWYPVTQPYNSKLTQSFPSETISTEALQVFSGGQFGGVMRLSHKLYIHPGHSTAIVPHLDLIQAIVFLEIIINKSIFKVNNMFLLDVPQPISGTSCISLNIQVIRPSFLSFFQRCAAILRPSLKVHVTFQTM